MRLIPFNLFTQILTDMQRSIFDLLKKQKNNTSQEEIDSSRGMIGYAENTWFKCNLGPYDHFIIFVNE
jgi:hypothetical protein